MGKHAMKSGDGYTDTDELLLSDSCWLQPIDVQMSDIRQAKNVANRPHHKVFMAPHKANLHAAGSVCFVHYMDDLTAHY